MRTAVSASRVKSTLGATWHGCLVYDLYDGERCVAAPTECRHCGLGTNDYRPLIDQQQGVLIVEIDNDASRRLFRQATDNSAALRMPIASGDCTQIVPAAGLPWFVALFGRDSLIASFQSTLVYPEFARGTLEVLGSLQATERDDYRDAEPGKILHELRPDELAKLKLIPIPRITARQTPLDRLPELYAGLHRDATSFPVQYLGANVPRA